MRLERPHCTAKPVPIGAGFFLALFVHKTIHGKGQAALPFKVTDRSSGELAGTARRRVANPARPDPVIPPPLRGVNPPSVSFFERAGKKLLQDKACKFNRIYNGSAKMFTFLNNHALGPIGSLKIKYSNNN